MKSHKNNDYIYVKMEKGEEIISNTERTTEETHSTTLSIVKMTCFFQSTIQIINIFEKVHDCIANLWVSSLFW